MSILHDSHRARDYFTRHNHSECHNFTPDYATLHHLNHEKAVTLIPVMVYVFILIITGIIGNSLVIHVYACRFKKTPSNRFILWLAILDLITCTIGMPFEIYDLARPLRFNRPWACSFFRWLSSTTIITSAFVLIAVAFDRYYKAFKPFKRLEVRSANRLNCGSLAIGLSLSWPAMIIFGRKSICVDVPSLGIVILGSECSVDDAMKDTLYPFIYYGVLFVMYLMLLLFKAILYGRLGREIIRRKRPGSLREPTKSKSSDKESSSCLPIEDSQNDRRAHWKQTVISQASNDSPDQITSNTQVTGKRKISSLKRFTAKIRAGRTTMILFTVSLAFVVSFLPYLTAKILQGMIKDFTNFSSSAYEVIYNICARTQYINNAINPVIYGFLNPNFRNECHVFLRCWGRKKADIGNNTSRRRQKHESNSNSC